MYNPSAKEVSIVDVPEMSFLMIDGEGDPNTSQEYQDSIEALLKPKRIQYLIKLNYL
ncbi:GyrI-like domain-containing protein [Methanosarcina barkeri]|uniref:GyrI-like domain-containing protein n=1 Tax=Methanosarcina barkeri TaxID=2208 RepID=UPI0000385E45|nr:GyrI-like domain-containing protein [Methanosarcina barkeri]